MRSFLGAVVSACLQVQAREREVQQTRDVKEDFGSRLKELEGRLRSIAGRLGDKPCDLEQAREETKVIKRRRHID